ncbi:exophilin 5 [Phyllostomus discolor]|uniref:Exophilin 5 n=1 Tax=Phyllostomus discolor TaxID=89673 RepID=A0A834A5F0_9CHIR|nr:exophilin 5 [Phyllostomus discolor]
MKSYRGQRRTGSVWLNPGMNSRDFLTSSVVDPLKPYPGDCGREFRASLSDQMWHQLGFRKLLYFKLQKTKRDIRWLQGVTGEWFEEIQRKKFCNETDVSQMLKQPLTYRLKKGMAENDPMELQTSQSKTTPTQRNPTPVPSRLSFRSSFASLFSFGKPRKETLKPHWLGPKG